LPASSSAGDLPVELFQRHPQSRVRIKLRIAKQRLCDTLVLVMKNGRKRSKQMSGEEGSLVLR